MIYEHLDYPFTIKLANDLIVAVDPAADEVAFLVSDDHGIYNVLTDITSKKPSAGEAELFLRLQGLFKTEKFYKGEIIDTEHNLKKDVEFINYHYHHKTIFDPRNH